jgi:hypothetical protein
MGTGVKRPAGPRKAHGAGQGGHCDLQPMSKTHQAVIQIIKRKGMSERKNGEEGEGGKGRDPKKHTAQGMATATYPAANKSNHSNY